MLADVQRGVVTKTRALTDYGVVIDDGGVAKAATAKARAAAIKISTQGEGDTLFDFGVERMAWDDVFEHGLNGQVSRYLSKLAPAQRQSSRTRLFAPVARVVQKGMPLDPASLCKAGKELTERLADVAK